MAGSNIFNSAPLVHVAIVYNAHESVEEAISGCSSWNSNASGYDKEYSIEEDPVFLLKRLVGIKQS